MAGKRDISDVVGASVPPKEDPTNTTTRARRSTTLSQAAAAAKKTTTPKYVQLRGDQQIELDVLARELQGARESKAERITANTVIRVACDFLLARRDVLEGDTEDQLRSSLLSYVKHLEDRSTRLRELEEGPAPEAPAPKTRARRQSSSS
ncbi:hypothetical protein ACIRPK_34145 [Kitasatospora sp. NPDC101801]|uniref:hypothetical protein n=1 Tax=Kitasatospora sp. NPDC101801 TaxID=3364103 RepID=UPI0037F34692